MSYIGCVMDNLPFQLRTFFVQESVENHYLDGSY